VSVIARRSTALVDRGFCGEGLLGGVEVLEVERFQVVLVLDVVGLDDVVEAGVAQGVRAFFPVELVGPFAVLGDLDGPVFGLSVCLEGLHDVVVDEEAPAVVAGQGDVVVLVAEDDVDDLAVAGVVEFDRSLRTLVWLSSTLTQSGAATPHSALGWRYERDANFR